MLKLSRSSPGIYYLLIIIIIFGNITLIGMTYYFIDTRNDLIDQIDGYNDVRVNSISLEGMNENSELIIFDEIKLLNKYEALKLRINNWFLSTNINLSVGDSFHQYTLVTSLNYLENINNVTLELKLNDSFITLPDDEGIDITTVTPVNLDFNITVVKTYSKHVLQYALNTERLIYTNMVTFQSIWRNLQEKEISHTANYDLFDDNSLHNSFKQLKERLIDISDELSLFHISQSMTVGVSLPKLNLIEEQEHRFSIYVLIAEITLIPLLLIFGVITLFLINYSINSLHSVQIIFINRGISTKRLIKMTQAIYTKMIGLGFLASILGIASMSLIYSIDLNMLISTVTISIIYSITLHLLKNKYVIDNYETHILANKGEVKSSSFTRIAVKNDLVLFFILIVLGFGVNPLAQFMDIRISLPIKEILLSFAFIHASILIWKKGVVYLSSRLANKNGQKFGLNVKYMTQGLFYNNWKMKFILVILISTLVISFTSISFIISINHIHTINEDWHSPLEGNYNLNSDRNTINDYNKFVNNKYVSNASWLVKGSIFIDSLEYPLVVINNPTFFLNSSKLLEDNYNFESNNNLVLIGENIKYNSNINSKIKVMEHINNSQGNPIERETELQLKLTVLDTIKIFPTINNVKNSVFLLYNNHDNYLSNDTAISSVFFNLTDEAKNLGFTSDAVWNSNEFLGHEGYKIYEPYLSFQPILNFMIYLIPIILIFMTSIILSMVKVFSVDWYKLSHPYIQRGENKSVIIKSNKFMLLTVLKVSYLVSFPLMFILNNLIAGRLSKLVQFELPLITIEYIYGWIGIVLYVELIVRLILRKLNYYD